MGQCVEGNRAQPFISDQAGYLDKHQSIVLTRAGVYQGGWDETRIYTAYDRNAAPWRRMRNRISDAVEGVPWEFSAAIYRHRVCLLHAHHGMFAIRFLRLREKFDLPLIASFYGYDASGFPRSSSNSMKQLRNLFSESVLVIAMSQDMRRDLNHLGCPEEKLVIHHTGVDLRRFPFRPPRTEPDEAVILCVCDFSPKKGVRDLVAAFRAVLEAFPEARLRIVGAPITIALEEHAKVLRMIRNYGLDRSVTLAGRVDYFSTPQEYQQADLFVLPSVTAPDGSKEGIPAVLMEAASTGLPIVSTYHAGIPEAVLDGQSGFLVKEGDAAALSAAMRRLLRERKAWGSMGRCGRELMERRFDITQKRHELDDIYTHTLETAKRRS